MTGYTYGWKLAQFGYVEVAESEYTNAQKEMRLFIDDLSSIVVKANCGWDGLQYKVMKNNFNNVEEYMVLCVDGNGERWIPITCNSKGLNLQVLGDNIW